MKTLIFICSVFFAGLLIPAQENLNTSQSIEVEKAKDFFGPTITIRIGRKKYDCDKFGLCKMTIEPDEMPKPGSGNRGGSIGSNYNGGLQLNVLKSTMDVATTTKYFSNDAFIVGEDFEIPNEIVQSLNLRRTVIPTGQYSVTDLGETLQVNF